MADHPHRAGHRAAAGRQRAVAGFVGWGVFPTPPGGGFFFVPGARAPWPGRWGGARQTPPRRGWNLAPVYLVEFEDESGRLTTCRVMIDTFQKAEPGLEGMLVTRGKRFVSFGEDENEED